jgi:hypothetical protein
MVSQSKSLSSSGLSRSLLTSLRLVLSLAYSFLSCFHSHFSTSLRACFRLCLSASDGDAPPTCSVGALGSDDAVFWTAVAYSFNLPTAIRRIPSAKASSTFVKLVLLIHSPIGHVSHLILYHIKNISRLLLVKNFPRNQ